LAATRAAFCPALGYRRDVPDEIGRERVRSADVIAALSLATDLGMSLPLEHGLQSTLVAMRLADRLGVDPFVARETYYGCLLFYVGCTADAEVGARDFEEDIHVHFTPAMFGSRAEILRALSRAMAPSGSAPGRAARVARGLPRVMRGYRGHLAALCEVGEMLTGRVGLPPAIQRLFPALNERWDGKGYPGTLSEEGIPLPVRIVHVARDATFQASVGGADHAVGVVSERAGKAFDPQVAACLVDGAGELLALDEAGGSAWERVLELEPAPAVWLAGDAIERALRAIGDFADLVSPYLVGHSSGVAELAAAAAAGGGRLAPDEVLPVRRAAFVHDVGRVAVPAKIWQKAGPLSADEWERVRLHPYHTERVLIRSSFLGALAPVASAHHERMDGSGYHRGVVGTVLSASARLLAAADAYHAMTEPRPHRGALSADQASELLAGAASAGRLDADAVASVLEAAGQRVPRIERPAGLTEREAEVVRLLARGLQTKQIAHALGISVKTADQHVQNAYAKIGVSTRAAAALFAMEHGLVASGEFPIPTSATGA
jgi:HD-GYP domain-containing protein (c-di-GMP phosphodiesterase class II)